MYCPNCKKQIDDDSIFCYSCGTQVAPLPMAEQPRLNTGTIDLDAIQAAMNNGVRTMPTDAVVPTVALPGAIEIPETPLNTGVIETNEVGPIGSLDLPADNKNALDVNTKYHDNPILDFCLRMTRPGNRLVMVWLLLNYLMFWAFTAAFMMELVYSWHPVAQYAAVTVVSLLLALASYTIALSPLGEALLRWENRCKKITDPNDLAILKPCFDTVYAKAKALDPHLSDKIELFISDDKSINAFATGRNTICVTKGLLETKPEIIEATLAHEFGHLSHRDTDMILIVEVGNQIWNLLTTIFAISARVVAWMGTFMEIFTDRDSRGMAALSGWVMAAIMTMMVWVMRLWSKVGMLILRHSMRSHEYEADAFAFDLGYSQELTNLLTYFSQFSAGAQGLFASLSSTHPEPEQRIQHIQELAAARGL